MLWRCNMASCRVLFAGIFTFSSFFLNSRGVLLLRGMLFFFLVSQFTIVRGASTLRVPLQVFVGLQVFAWRFKSSRGAPRPFSSLWQHRFQSCDAQRTYDSLILILHLKRGYSPFCASVLLITKGRLPNINIAQISHFSNFFELKRRSIFIYEPSKPEQCQIFS